MPGEGQGGGPEIGGSTGAPAVENPGSSPEHKASYNPPSQEEQDRLEDLKNIQTREAAARVAARAASSGGTRQPEENIFPEIPNAINSELSPEELAWLDKMKEMPWDVIQKISDAKRAAEGKPPVKLLQADVSGTGLVSEERFRALELAYNELRDSILKRQDQEEGIGVVTKENWMEEARYDHAPKYHKDYISVRILDQMGRNMWVYWPKDEIDAAARVRDVIGRIELAREDVDPQLSLEYQRIQAILGAIKASKTTLEEGYAEVLEEGRVVGHKLEMIRDPNQIIKIQEFNEGLNLEFKGRRTFHQAFFTYETQSSIEAVSKSAVSLGPNDFNALFGIKEKISGTNESFNPFVEALQFYEDHGHEFARNNSEIGRPLFGEKVVAHLTDYIVKSKLGLSNIQQKDFTPEQKAKYQELLATINRADYKWAQNLAERFFRFSGRAEMYDYLVVNKGKADEQVVKYLDPWRDPISGKKIKGEKVSVAWASDRDGCDYDMTKILRFREFLRQEGGLRAHLGLLAGVETFGGDLVIRTIVGFYSTKAVPVGEKSALSYRVSKEKLDEKIKKVMVEDKLTREQAEKLFYVVEEPDWENIADLNEKQKIRGIFDADLSADREDSDNEGEKVGRINFRLMARNYNEKGEPETPVVDKEGKAVKGFNFKSMGTTPLGLWVTRYVNGPEKLRESLMGKADSFLNNPNIESLRALINSFDFQKILSHKNLKQLGVNFIMFGRKERKEKTGKSNFSRAEVIASVNDLAGLTDPNKPALFNIEDRKEVLEKVFGHPYTDLLTKARLAGVGFINFFLGAFWYILKQGFGGLGK